jgi:hypothetical protein
MRSKMIIELDFAGQYVLLKTLVMSYCLQSTRKSNSRFGGSPCTRVDFVRPVLVFVRVASGVLLRRLYAICTAKLYIIITKNTDHTYVTYL